MIKKICILFLALSMMVSCSKEDSIETEEFQEASTSNEELTAKGSPPFRIVLNTVRDNIVENTPTKFGQFTTQKTVVPSSREDRVTERILIGKGKSPATGPKYTNISYAQITANSSLWTGGIRSFISRFSSTSGSALSGVSRNSKNNGWKWAKVNEVTKPMKGSATLRFTPRPGTQANQNSGKWVMALYGWIATDMGGFPSQIDEYYVIDRHRGFKFNKINYAANDARLKEEALFGFGETYIGELLVDDLNSNEDEPNKVRYFMTEAQNGRGGRRYKAFRAKTRANGSRTTIDLEPFLRYWTGRGVNGNHYIDDVRWATEILGGSTNGTFIYTNPTIPVPGNSKN